MNMSTADSCNECAAILDELRNVAGYSGTPEQLRKRLGATLPVILSADDDALEELLQKHPFRLMARDADGTPLQRRRGRPNIKRCFAGSGRIAPGLATGRCHSGSHPSGSFRRFVSRTQCGLSANSHPK